MQPGDRIRFIDDVLRRLPFRVLIVQTDYYGAEFQSRFHCHLDALDVRHVHIRPRPPHLNGKVEPLDGQTQYERLIAKMRASSSPAS